MPTLNKGLDHYEANWKEGFISTSQTPLGSIGKGFKQSNLDAFLTRKGAFFAGVLKSSRDYILPLVVILQTAQFTLRSRPVTSTSAGLHVTGIPSVPGLFTAKAGHRPPHAGGSSHFHAAQKPQHRLWGS